MSRQLYLSGFSLVLLVGISAAISISGLGEIRSTPAPEISLSLQTQASAQTVLAKPVATLTSELKTSVLRTEPVTTAVLPAAKKGADFVATFSAQALAIQELGGSAPLLEKNLKVRWPLASLTKLLTAVVAKEKFGLDRQIPISAAAVSQEGSSANLVSGEAYALSELLKALLLTSSNDAAAAISETYGNIPFLLALQAKAQELQLTETVLADGSGLSYLNQGTVADIFKLMSYLEQKHPDLLELTRFSEATMLETTTGKSRLLKSTHPFSGEANFLGGKTGYTELASGNLVSIFSAQNKLYVITVFGSADRFKETKRLYDWLVKETAQ